MKFRSLKYQFLNLLTSLSLALYPVVGLAQNQCADIYTGSISNEAHETAFAEFKKTYFENDPAAKEILEQIEKRSIEFLTLLIAPRKGDPDADFRAYFKESLLNKNVGVADYLVLVQVLKLDLLQGELADLKLNVQERALQLRQTLTGESEVTLEQLNSRLPREVMSQQSKEVIAIHDASFAPSSLSITEKIKYFAQSYKPKMQDFLVGTLLLSATFHHLGRDIVAGALSGYAICSFLEFTIHKYIGHGSRELMSKMKEMTSRFGILGKFIHSEIAQQNLMHGTIHHGSYGGNYVKRFAPREEVEMSDKMRQSRTERRHQQMDQQLRDEGEGNYEFAQQTQYGTSLRSDIESILTFMPFGATLSLFGFGAAHVLGADLGLSFVAASTAASTMFVPVSRHIHPYLHMTQEEAFAQASLPMQWFLKSRWFAHLARSHYHHHREVKVNQNLVPGADLFFGYRSINVREILELIRYKTFY